MAGSAIGVQDRDDDRALSTQRSAEEQFYIVWPALIVLAPPRDAELLAARL